MKCFLHMAAAITGVLSVATPTLCGPVPGDAIASLLIARANSAENGTSSSADASINSNNTADCTNCTNLGNFVNPLPVYPSDPVVKTRNGSYAGLHIAPIPASSTFSGFGTSHPQEAFLGIPYAAQPVDDLRFRRPQTYNESWTDVRSAKRYSEICFGVGPDNDYDPPFVTYKNGERCLTVNVVRPANVSGKLPVYVWIHGGGFLFGGSADRRYNGSFIVDRSVDLGQPVVFVSLNYRTSVLGFPVGDVAETDGIQNLGLYDQRLALHWIRENIEAFGGDKDKVTIVGESAGGASMWFHLTAYRGRDENLFRGVAAESAYFATQYNRTGFRDIHNQRWSSLASYAGCSASDLACLRKVPLNVIKTWSENATLANLIAFNPVIDGDLVARDLQASFIKGEFVKDVNLIVNANDDEGLSFGVRGVNTSEQIFAALESPVVLPIIQPLPDNALTNASKADLARIYPDDEDIYTPYQAGPGLLPPQTVPGSQDRRSCSIFGDLEFVGPRRQVASLVAKASNSAVYVSRFDQLVYKATIVQGAPHFVEVSSVFRNPLDTQNALGPQKRDNALANEMSSYWISFVASGDPNKARNDGKLENAKAPYWPQYNPDGDRGSIAWVDNGLGKRSYVLPDTYRIQGTELLMDIRSGSYEPSKFTKSNSSTMRDEL